MSDKKYTPGYIEVPGKGQRYQDSSGKLYNNHFGPSLNQVGNFFGSIGPAYNDYYNNFADAVGTERRDGTIKKPEPEKTKKPTFTSGLDTNKITVDGVTYDMRLPEHKKMMNAAIDKSQSTRKPPVVPDRDPVVPTGRDTAAPDGGAGKGTSMGSSVLQMDEVNKILNARGISSITSPYSSNNLPGVDYSGEDAAAFGRSTQDSAVIGRGGSVETTFDGDKPPVSVLQQQGSPELVADGAISADSPGSAALSPDTASIPKRPRGARQAEKWDRKYGNADFGGQSEAPETSGFDMARRRAFLDAESGLKGMEEVKAMKGIYTDNGGQSYTVDPNNEGQMMAISANDKRTLLGSDEQKAQDLLGSYVSTIKEADIDEDDK